MKILFASSYFYPVIGGLEFYIYNIAKRLAKKHEVIIISSNTEKKEFKVETIDGMKVYRLPISFRLSNTPLSLTWLWQVEKILRKEKPDLVNAHMPVPFLGDLVCRAAKKQRIPYIVTYHNGSMKKEGISVVNPFVYLYEHFYLPRLLKQAKKVICSSEYVRSGFLNKYKDLCTTINPGVDLDRFYPKKKKKGKSFNILYVGKIDSTAMWKGLPYLYEAFFAAKEKKKNLSLTMVGPGNLVEPSREKYKNKISFLGPKRGKDLLKEFWNCDLFVLPSTDGTESFGMVLAEANACGKPVIGSDDGGIPQVIEPNVNGLLVPPKDSKALAAAILKVANDQKLAESLGKAGIKKAQTKWNWDRLAEQQLKGFTT